MSKEIDISIVIVNYNVKDFLYQCLQSIQDSKCDLHVETIVVDNNSTDGTEEEIAKKFPEFILLKNKTR